jgi:succinate dehydrogenase / fumarate reductase iron-sulfur subunit
VKWVEDKYLGPAAMVWAYRYLFDSRDDHRAGRLEQLDAIDLAWGCVSHFECTRVCPKEIPVTKSINEVKREIEKARR